MRKFIDNIKYYFEFMLQEIFTWWMLRNHKKMIESSQKEFERYDKEGWPELPDPTKNIPPLRCKKAKDAKAKT